VARWPTVFVLLQPISIFFAYSATNAYALIGHGCLWHMAILCFSASSIVKPWHRADEFTMGSRQDAYGARPSGVFGNLADIILMSLASFKRQSRHLASHFLPAPIPFMSYNHR
jgi:hypothetical protein